MSSPNTNKKQIPSSFSSPEFMASASGVIETSVLSTDSTMDSIATNVSTSLNTGSVRIVKSFASATRDSGFSDSVVEDSSSSSISNLVKKQTSPGVLLSRTEHILTLNQNTDPNITLHTKIISGEKSRLKSVEEDIDIIQAVETKSGKSPEDENKEIITIVKTTKLTTKVEKVKKNSKSKNKKKNRSKAALSFTPTTTTSTIEEKVPQVAKTDSTSEPESQDESGKLNQENSETNILKVDIKKSTEELVFQTIPGNKISTDPETQTDLTFSNEIKQNIDQQGIDLNSTVLDCEEILSTYSCNNPNNPSSPRHVEISEPTVCDSINEVVTVVDVLSDVTHVLINQADKIEPEIKKEIQLNSSTIQASSTKRESSKKRFSLFSRLRSKTREKEEKEPLESNLNNSKRKLDQKTAEPSSPSKQLKIDKTFVFEKYEILNSDEKDRILYMKPECIELIVNNLQFNFNLPNLRLLISRSLDLLRHDRIESFDKLSQQLIEEYNTDTHETELVFKHKLKELIQDEKVLLKLNLDKERAMPCEEIILFNTATTSSEWARKFESIKIEPIIGANLPTIIKQTKLETEASNNAKLDDNLNAKQETANSIKLEENLKKANDNLIQITKEMIEESKKQEEMSSLVNQVEAKLLSEKESSHENKDNCGATPPSTPQNEQINNSGDSSKIVLNTQKEPPILFQCDLEPDKKPVIIKVPEISSPVVQVVQKEPENLQTSKKGSKKSKNKKSPLSCLSCAGGGSGRKSENEDNAPQTKLAESSKKSEVLLNIPSLIAIDIDNTDKSQSKEKSSDELKPSAEDVKTETTEILVEQIQQQEAIENSNEQFDDPSKFISLDTDDSNGNVIQETLTHTEVKVEQPVEQVIEVVEEIKKEIESASEVEEKQEENAGKSISRQESTQSNQDSKEKLNKKAKNKKKKKKNKKSPPKEIAVEPVVDIKASETIHIPTITAIGSTAAEIIIPVMNQLNGEELKSHEKEENEKIEIDVPIEPPVDLAVGDVEDKIEESIKETIEAENLKINIDIPIEPPVDLGVTVNSAETKIEIEKETQEMLKPVVEITEGDYSIKNLVQIQTTEIVTSSSNEIVEIKSTEETIVLSKQEQEDIKLDITPENVEKQDNLKEKEEGQVLDINQEIKIESEQSVPQVLVDSANKTNQQSEKRPDIVKLEVVPRPAVVSSPVVITTVESKPEKKKSTKKDSDDDGSKISCFSCKSKKAKEAKKSKQEPVKPVSTGQAVKQEEVKVQITSVTDEKSAKPSTMSLNSNLFTGLDGPTVDRGTIDIPSISSIEIQKPTQTSVSNQPQSLSQTAVTIETSNLGSFKEFEGCTIEQVTSPSLIGSTSFEAMPQTNVIDESEKQSEQVQDPLKEEEKSKEEPTVIEIEQKPTLEINLQEEPVKPKVLSDDIVVLPDPSLRPVILTSVPIAPPVSIETKPAAPVQNKPKKSGGVSCFSSKKSSKKIDKQSAPIDKPKEEKQVQASEPKKIEQKAQNLPPSNWSVGLDRGEGKELEKKEPVISGIRKDPPPIKEKQLTNINIEVPSVIDVDSIQITREEKVTKQEVKAKDTQIALTEPSKILQANLTIESPGAIIKIDREPDHAVIPDLSKDRVLVVKPTTSEQAQESSTQQPKTEEKSKSERKAKKTSVIDLPLINILDPKEKKSKKAKTAVESKKLEVSVPSTSAQPKINLTQNIVGVVDLGGGLDKPEMLEKETKVEISIPKDLEIKEINVDVKLEQSVPAETAKAPEVNIEINQVTDVFETTESVVPVEEIKSESVTQETVVEVEVPVKQEQEIPKLESPEVPPVDIHIPVKEQEVPKEELKAPADQIIKIDRVPDVVALPELDLSSRLQTQKIQEQKIEIPKEEVKVELKKKSDKKEKGKRPTSFIDLPIIDVFAPKEAKTKTKKSKAKEELSKPSAEFKSETLPTATQVYIDMPVVDLIVPEVKVEKPKVETVELKKEQTLSSKTTSVIDMPLIDILKPSPAKEEQKAKKKAKKEKSNKASCFLCKSKQAKKTSKKDEPIPKPPVVEAKVELVKEPEIKLDLKGLDEAVKSVEENINEAQGENSNLAKIVSEVEEINKTEVQVDVPISPPVDLALTQNKDFELEEVKPTGLSVLKTFDEPEIIMTENIEVEEIIEEKKPDLEASEVEDKNKNLDIDVPIEPPVDLAVTEVKSKVEESIEENVTNLVNIVQEAENIQVDIDVPIEPPVDLSIPKIPEDSAEIKVQIEPEAKTEEMLKPVVEITEGDYSIKNLVQIQTTEIVTSSSNEIVEIKSTEETIVLSKQEQEDIKLDITPENVEKQDNLKEKEEGQVLDINQEIKIESEQSVPQVLVDSANKTNQQSEKRPDIVKLEVVPRPAVVSSPVVITTVESKPEKKKSTKKDSDDDGSKISCFSCKSKKAKEAKKSKQEPVKKETKPEPSVKEETIQPQIRHLSTNLSPDIFKGLDKPSTVSDGEHITDFQGFLDVTVVKETETSFKTPQVVPSEVESLPVEIQAPISVELTLPEVSPEVNLQTVPQVTEQIEEKEEVKLEKPIDILPPEITAKVDLPQEVVTQEDQVLPVSKETLEETLVDVAIVTPPAVNVSVELPKQESKQENKENIAIKTSEEKKSKFSCLICGSNKQKKAKAKVKSSNMPKEVTKKPEIEIPTPNLIIEQQQPLQSEIDPKIPPKKPPRGHLDTSVVLDGDSLINSSVPVQTIETPEVNLTIQASKSEQTNLPEAKISKEKPKGHTSLIDMPLIDILIPKEKKSKKIDKTESPKQQVEQIVPVTSTESKPVVKAPVDHSLFKGLDSDGSIVFTKPAVEIIQSLPEELKIEVKGTSVELNQPDVELFVNKEEIVENTSNKKIEPQVEYISKKSDSWIADPLPHVQIGAYNPLLQSKEEPVVKVKVDQIEVAKTSNGVEVPKTSKQSEQQDLIKSLSAEEKKQLKLKRDQAIDYLKTRSGYKLEQLVEQTTSTTSKKELKSREKLADKLYKRSLKLIIKTRAHPLTYTELSKKLEKVVSAKTGSADIEKCVKQLKQDLEDGNLMSNLRGEKNTPEIQTEIKTKEPVLVQEPVVEEIKVKVEEEKVQEQVVPVEEPEQSDVIRRFPNLTWREANERARILFYKGRVPSIHYNEKRDSFHVSMLTQIISNGKEKLTEVPVLDEDVRRLLNSCGLYWDGESISLLNKSDEIFSNAQQEAFDILNLLAASSSSPAQADEQSNTVELTANQESKINLIC